ncbi:6898_t:CDS:2, partial [Gigaspora rosea]
FNEANSTFFVSEANFILHEWLTSYCNSMVNEAKAKGYTLAPKKNVKPPIRKCNDTTNNVNAKSILDQSDTDETDNLQDSLDIDQEKNKVTKAKAKEQKECQKWHNGNTNSINIESDHDRNDTDEIDNAQDSFGDNNNVTFNQDNIHKAAHNSDTLTTIIDVDDNSKYSSFFSKHDNIKNAEHNEQYSGVLDEIGGKRKSVQKAKEPSSHKARVTKK